MSDEYGLAAQTTLAEIPAPALDYRPPRPRDWRGGIGLIGCGGIAGHHLAAYQRAGFPVVALCGREAAKPRALAAKYFPDAALFTDHRALLRRSDIAVVDITTHAPERVALIEDALAAGKHVLSQKPFVLDLDTGERLAALAAARGLQLAVNQNGRWAPHFRWMLQAVRTGVIGPVGSLSIAMNWDHAWIAGTPFEEVRHLILGDFGIHWFDLTAALFAGRRARRVFATATRAPDQSVRPPMVAQVAIEFDDAQATLAFHGLSSFGQSDRTVVVGAHGTLISAGPSLSDQQVTLYTSEGIARPQLEGTWFTSGFEGAMAELLCAIQEEREPENSARANLASLALCFAAMTSAESGQPVAPGEARRWPHGNSLLSQNGTGSK
jgi:predicted dehydrogenase